jgi:hypothetical protein
MRKKFVLTALALILIAATAHAVTIGVGAFGGLSIPIVNDLSTQGSVFGVRAPVGISPMFTAEAFYSQAALGDVEESFGGPTSYTRDGGDVTAFGANAIFNFGGGGGSFHFFPFVGIGSYQIKRSGSEDINDVGYNFGLGVGFALPSLARLSFDVRGEAVMVKTDNTSQKLGNVTAGVTYKLFSTPTP